MSRIRPLSLNIRLNFELSIGKYLGKRFDKMLEQREGTIPFGRLNPWLRNVWRLFW